MSDKIRLVSLIVIFGFLSFFVYNYYSIKNENNELKLSLEETNAELDKAVSINKSNSDTYDKELERIKTQIAEINKINKDLEVKNSSVKDNIKVIDEKIKDKPKEEKNKILKQELNNIINIINEK